MKHPLLAYFLACLTLTALLSAWTSFAAPHFPASNISVRINAAQMDETIKAIEGLNIKDLQVIGASRQEDEARSFTMIRTALFMAFGLMVITGLVLFFYKLYCRWLGIIPTL